MKEFFLTLYRFLFVLLGFSIFLGCSSDDDTEPIEMIFTPLIEFSYQPEEIHAGQEVNFSGRWQTGSSVIESWNWNFGDNLSIPSNSQNSSYVYAEEGTYIVSLTATDAKDSSATVYQEITVLPPLKDPYQAEIAWSFSNNTAITTANDASRPAMDDNGDIYYLENYAGAESRVIALTDDEASATKKWEVVTGYNTRQSPSIGPLGNIYVGVWATDKSILQINSQSGDVFAFEGVGSGISNSAAAIDQDGNTYYGTRSAGIFSYDATGQQRWNFQSANSGARYYASPAISKDGSTVYAIATGGELFALNTSDGTLKWSEPITFNGDGTGASLSINSDGTVYYTSTTEVGAITDNGASGSVKWTYNTEGANSSAVSIGLEGILYVGSSKGLIALNPADGTEMWVYDAVIEESVPAIDSEGNIYIGTKDGKLLVVNAEGELLKQFNLSTNIVNSPLIADDGSIYVEAFDGEKITLFKISVENIEGPANTSWPMKGQNRKGTAMAN
ncbi:PQQ-binding-like beta-propeller repeat protein [uncultured Draconibacterium sp.]|uniref:outer membrane protein assembly factor BamB family protein n=1 Tax=uncultured Draconibacterium sp. TaxID=1573823 RepID=UPI0029C8A21B|nr:PQQ-binding-like beta-propeller repeat protein [uncultured Draconibacterium sp.]